MFRLDARVKTYLPSSSVTYYRENTEEQGTVRELSLSGILMHGCKYKISDTLLIKFPLSKNKYVEMYGDVVRIQDTNVAVKLYLSEQDTIEKLWEFIKDKIYYQNICPYCDHSNKLDSVYCEKCGWYVNFKSGDYLDKHIQETFAERITRRVGNSNSEHLKRVLNLVDKEVLAAKGMSMDKQFLGTGKVMLGVFSLIRKVAPTENPVLLLGESGTGKDLTAKAIHERSRRKNGPYVVINCAAIPEGLLEAELFGYEKGAFTGAYMNKNGKFEQAHGGTVFLDEIAELPQPLQAKLLRVLEDQFVERLGGKGGEKVDVRVITATNKNLEQEVMKMRFRVDLYHRINTFTVTLPPLRDREEDKMVIAKYYLKKFCAQEGIVKQFSKKSLDAINWYSWPGNIRELINKVRRAIVVSQSDVITPFDLNIEMIGEKEISSLGDLKAHIEKQHLIEILKMTSNNISKAARLLGVSRPTIYALIKRYGLMSSDS